jgi:hypothetical protein
VLDDKKAVKYEEKVPEELLAVKSKNDMLRKQITQVKHKIDIEKA